MTWLRYFRWLYRPKLFKFLLVLWMINSTGIFTAMEISHRKEKAQIKLANEEKQARIQVLETLAAEKVAHAKALVESGWRYGPDEYFNDLLELDLKEEELYTTIPVQSYMRELFTLMYKCDPSNLEIQKASSVYANKLNYHLHKQNPDANAEKMGFKKIVWIILVWLMWVYVHNLLPSAILYIVWIVERKDNRFPKPLQFLKAVAAHPYYLARILGIWIERKSWDALAEAEYRRTKDNLFAFLSVEETQRIKNFVQSGLPIGVWKKQLAAQGLKPIHSLAAALLVTLIFTVLPRPVEAKATPSKDVSSAFCIECYIHLPRMSIEEAKLQADLDIGHGWDSGGEKFFCKEDFALLHGSSVGWLIFLTQPFLLQEIWRKIFHVPISRLFSFAFGCFHFAD